MAYSASKNNAKAICKTEKADKFLVDLAILLHDVGDRKVINKDEDDYSIAENCLKRNGVTPETVESVMFIIKKLPASLKNILCVLLGLELFLLIDLIK